MEEKSVCEQKHFEVIFDQCSEEVRNFIYYKYGNLKVAEDVVQESFIKLWENCVKVPFEKARAYVYQVARNKMLNHIAHQKVVLKYETESVASTNIQDPQYLIEEKEFEKKLIQAIQDLPEKQRESFLLSRMEKKTYREISEITGVTVKAIEKRMQQALETLREKLGDLL